MPPRLIFAYLFRALALISGLPSLASTLYFGWAALQIHFADPGTLPSASPSSIQLLSLVDTTARAIGTVFQWMGNLGEWVMIVAFVISAVIFLFALLMWFTATGLVQDKLWARVTASLCGVALLSIVSGAVMLRSAMR